MYVKVQETLQSLWLLIWEAGKVLLSYSETGCGVTSKLSIHEIWFLISFVDSNFEYKLSVKDEVFVYCRSVTNLSISRRV